MKCSTKHDFLLFSLSNTLFLFNWTYLGPSQVSLSASTIQDCNNVDTNAIRDAIAAKLNVDPSLVTVTCSGGRRRRAFFNLPQFRQNSGLQINVIGVDHTTLQNIVEAFSSPTFLAEINEDLGGEDNDLGSISEPTVDTTDASGILILQLL